MTNSDVPESVMNVIGWAMTKGYNPNIDYWKDKPMNNDVILEDVPPGYATPHFRLAEYACNHCGKLPDDGMSPELMQFMEELRVHYGVPIVIHSGYRCPTHNRNVGGALRSQHLLGTAADFTVKGMSPAQVYADLDPYHDGGLGKYATFTHVDVRGHRARWSG